MCFFDKNLEYICIHGQHSLFDFNGHWIVFLVLSPYCVSGRRSPRHILRYNILNKIIIYFSTDNFLAFLRRIAWEGSQKAYKFTGGGIYVQELGLCSSIHLKPTISLEMPVPSQVFTVFRLLTDFVCLYTYEFWLSLCKIAQSSVNLLLPLSCFF
jgi:hypothetical protein